jgi:Nif11 domain
MTTITLNQAQTTANTSKLEQFFQEVLSNQVLQNKLRATTDLESLSQLVVALGEEYGYSFTIQEVQAASAVEAAIGCQWRSEDDLRVKSIDFDLPSGDGSNWGASQCHTCAF